MRLSPVLLSIAAVAAAAVVVVAGVLILQPNRPLLADVGFSLTTITPNADGDSDVTEIRYTLHRDAQITITFTAADGTRYPFRESALRPAGDYRVGFSGVVDGYLRPGETFPARVIRRLIPDGVYTWAVSAVGAADSQDTLTATGTLTLANGDSQLPLIEGFTISPPVFTPNQDGYDDRVNINLTLVKDSRLTVYLQGADNVPYYVSERFEGRKPGEKGAHTFDYDGGVDNNITPPPNGEYTVYASAEDAVGQRVELTGTVTLQDGGLPNAEIVAQTTGRTVTWETLPYDDSYFTDRETAGRAVAAPPGVQSQMAQITLPQGDLMVFRLTIYNYGTTSIRTIGPWPGTVYQYEQTDAAMTPTTSREGISGAWRVGVQCERSESSYPWRWAIGTPEELIKVERDGETLWYLPPGGQATVWGAVRMTRLIPTRNPQKCFVALIHEDVAIPPRQNRVGEIDVRLTPR